jgi:hypothetical protein
VPSPCLRKYRTIYPSRELLPTRLRNLKLFLSTTHHIASHHPQTSPSPSTRKVRVVSGESARISHCQGLGGALSNHVFYRKIYQFLSIRLLSHGFLPHCRLPLPDGAPAANVCAIFMALCDISRDHTDLCIFCSCALRTIAILTAPPP